MSLLAVVAAAALSVAPAQTVLVAGYQALGVDAAIATRLGEGFRDGANKPGLSALNADASEKSGRAAVMCGEDAACLSTLGQRSGATYVLAYGVGKVGNSLLVSALFIDVAAGKEIARASRRVLDASPDWVAVTRELCDLVVKPPAEPLIVQVPVTVMVHEKSHRWRTPAFVCVGIAALGGVATTIAGLFAYGNYSSLKTAADSGNSGTYGTLVNNQHALNAIADSFLIIGVLGVAAAIVFFILDRNEPEPVFDSPPAVPAASW